MKKVCHLADFFLCDIIKQKREEFGMNTPQLSQSQIKSKEINLKEFVLLVDTREQENRHIIDFCENNGIFYIEKKLDFGDYSFEYNNVSFEKNIAIERKGSLEELSGNLMQGRKRFENEHIRAGRARMYWLIESGNVSNIYDGAYKTLTNPNAFISRVISMQSRYNIQIDFVSKKWAGKHILNTFYYFLRMCIKNERELVSYEIQNQKIPM